ncbi:hypothetical protein [Ornithinibacillus halophilus]|uniref:Lipoprotein n=1 Tax=Ornithinibacillus halophilus TaxID=930117 RepID=A0A1M5F2U4_9BACI|nr:hypothetical protein [Ornithinibacillus halophilus]SHF85807.1 hypothetical protein SAMN05216225_100729 [Ornithinibacillus halophilus]
MTKRIFRLIIGLTTIGILLSGCFGDGISIPVGDGESIKIGTDEEDGVSFEATDKNGETVSFNASSDGEIPEDFPDYIPFPSDFQVNATTTITENGEKGMNVSYQTDSATFEEVWDMYQSFAEDNNYEEITSMTSNDYNTMLINNENESIGITAFAEENEDGNNFVTVNIVHLKVSEESNQEE